MDSNKDKNSFTSNFSNVWTKDDDIILKEWIDKAACYKWMHNRSYKIYWIWNLIFMIPVIVISTLTGTASFASERIPEPYRSYFTMVIGSFSIIAGIITTLYQFVKIGELKESHLISYKNFDKFNRTLKIELQHHPSERSNKKEIFDISKREYDRLIENAPDIPSCVVRLFKKNFKNKLELVKPDIADTIDSVQIYDNRDPIASLHNTRENIFIDKFKEKYKREPTSDEINEHFELNETYP
jgi:hypothetical protein